MAMQIDDIHAPYQIEIESFWKNNLEGRERQNIVFDSTRDYIQQAINNNQVVQIYEYQSFRFKIPFIFNKIILKIEGLKNNNDTLIISSNKKFISLDDFIQDENQYLAPGFYPIILKYEGEKFYSCFQVVPKNISFVQLNQIKKEIEEFAHGLIYDIRGNQRNHYKGGVINYEVQLINFLKRYKKQLLNNCFNIINNPIKKIIRTYEQQNNKLYFDQKSIRWLTQPKGQAINHDIRNPNILYQKTNKETLINDHNQWFVKIVNQICTELKEVKEKIEKQIKQEEERIVRIEKERVKLIKILKEAGANKNFKSQANSTYGRIKGIENDLALYKETIATIEKQLYIVNSLFKNLIFFKNSNVYRKNYSFYKDNSFLSLNFEDIRYKNLYRIYKKLLRLRSADKNSCKNYHFKRTDKLYEYYSLINVVRVFQDLGYIWSDGCLKNGECNDCLIDEIHSGSVFNFVKEDYSVNLTYEGEIKPSSIRALENEKKCFFTLDKNLTPDIRVDIYFKDKLCKSFVLEVKYRRFESIYNEEINTESMIQLNKYRNNIEYITMEGEIYHPIDEVIIIYPYDKLYNKVEKRFFNYFIFNQLSPSEKGVYGYEELKNNIVSILKKVT
ncbi:MAG: hypothetical protein ACOCQR_02785 [bacterium]